MTRCWYINCIREWHVFGEMWPKTITMFCDSLYKSPWLVSIKLMSQDWSFVQVFCVMAWGIFSSQYCNSVSSVRITIGNCPALLIFHEHEWAWIFMNIPVPFQVIIPVWIWTALLELFQLTNMNKHEQPWIRSYWNKHELCKCNKL